SAGKKRNATTRKGSRWLRATMVQAAWAASHTKATYFASHYKRLAKRRGSKKALIALAHTILGVVYYMLKRGTDFQELGSDYFERENKDRLTRHLIDRLERLGHRVTVEPQTPERIPV